MNNGWIAIGWGDPQFGHLSQYPSLQAISDAISQVYPNDTPQERSIGAHNLDSFYRLIAPHDYVILSTGKRRGAVMEVMGGYEYRNTTNIYPFNGNYGHQRRAQLVAGMDPNQLWRTVGGPAPGQNIRWTLVPCANTIP
jgi:predicted Mrr-cat superfamily restriction endonuclease